MIDHKAYVARRDARTAAIEPILRDFDFYGLIRGGAPNDEFDGEARIIADRIGDNIREHSNVAIICAAVFIERFGPFEAVVLGRLNGRFTRLASLVLRAIPR